MLSAVNKVILRLLPGALLLLAATIVLHPSGLRGVVAPLLPSFPLTVLGGGMLLAWRFGRSRLVLALAVLLLAAAGYAEYCQRGPGRPSSAP